MKSRKYLVAFTAFVVAVLMFLTVHPFAADVQEEKQAIAVPILMYHSLDPSSRDPWTIHPDELEQDLLYLRQQGYTCVFVSELVDYVDGNGSLPEKPVVLSFDDCYYNNLLYGLPLLEEYDAKMVLAVIGEYSQQFSEQEDLNASYAHLSWQQLSELYQTGRVELANHTWGMHTHSKGRDGCNIMAGEPLEKYRMVLSEDVEKLQETLWQQCGVRPSVFAYPFGSKGPEALQILKEMGFQATLSCYEGVNYLAPGDRSCLDDLHRNNRSPGRSAQQILTELGL